MFPRLGIPGIGASASASSARLARFGLHRGKEHNHEYRPVEGNLERLPAILAELVQLKVDVIYVGSLTGIRAAKQATKTIPIVMLTTADLVATGLIASLARPGGNITGLTILIRELTGKQLEILKEVVPAASRVGFLLDADSNLRLRGFTSTKHRVEL